MQRGCSALRCPPPSTTLRCDCAFAIYLHGGIVPTSLCRRSKHGTNRMTINRGADTVKLWFLTTMVEDQNGAL